jgi:hypothetical protein
MKISRTNGALVEIDGAFAETSFQRVLIAFVGLVHCCEGSRRKEPGMAGKEIVWTCPSCRLRNTSELGADVSTEKTIVVRCKGCEREQNVSPALALTADGTKKSVGVTWL